MNQAAGDAGNEEGVVNLQLDGMLELALALLEHGIQALGLGDGAGEAVEDEAVGKGSQQTRKASLGTSNGRSLPALAFLIVVKLLLDHADDNLVADETTLVHNLLGLATKGSLLGDLGAKHVTGGLLQRGRGG